MVVVVEELMALMEARDHHMVVAVVVVVEWVVPRKIQVPIYKPLTGIESNFGHLRKIFMYLILLLKEGKYLIINNSVLNYKFLFLF